MRVIKRINRDPVIKLTMEGDELLRKGKANEALRTYGKAKDIVTAYGEIDPVLARKIAHTQAVLKSPSQVEQAHLIKAISKGGIYFPEQTRILVYNVAEEPIMGERPPMREKYEIANPLLDKMFSPLRGPLTVRGKQLEKEGYTGIWLTIGDPTKVFKTPDFLMEARAKAAMDPSFYSYADPRGYEPLVDAVAKRFDVRIEDVVVATGESEG
ncbi:MAG: hypothetical protein AB1468_05830, partial [Candidatus Micrarchaeota archaeon]